MSCAFHVDQGKTTTLSILSGDIAPSRGKAYLDGLDIETEQMQVRRLIGYCPQHDALLDLLTVYEHLELYARIKGVPSSMLDTVIHSKMRQLDLLDFANKMAGTLSGGNKRKLSVAIAMIGRPKVIFLDEPSTGMDPVARRYMWDVISAMSTGNGQCSVILTTHSMEEAEALCTRIGIMVNGQLRCLGTGTHLKNRFGRGYELELKTELPARAAVQALIAEFRRKAPEICDADGLLTVGLDDPSLCSVLGHQGQTGHLSELTRREAGSAVALWKAASTGPVQIDVFCEWWMQEDTADKLRAWLRTTFEEVEELERSASNSFRYRITKGSLSLGDVFGAFEEASETVGIAQYSVGQTTLEQIFNQFAGTQDNPENQ